MAGILDCFTKIGVPKGTQDYILAKKDLYVKQGMDENAASHKAIDEFRNETVESLADVHNQIADISGKERPFGIKSKEDKPLTEKAVALLDEKIKEGGLGVFANMDKAETIQMIAEQAQNVTGGKVETDATGDNYQSTVSQFGQPLVDAAIKAHPLESLVSTPQPKADVPIDTNYDLSNYKSNTKDNEELAQDLSDKLNAVAYVKKQFKDNNLGDVDEDLVRQSFENQEITGETPPSKPPVDNVTEGKGDDDDDLNSMAANIPNLGKLSEYDSRETIEKYHSETTENDQSIIVQELTPALEHGEKIMQMAKEIFGEKDFVEKTLAFIENGKASVQAKALMYISLENSMARDKQFSPDKFDQKKQDLVRAKSQAFLRQASLAINFGKLRRIGLVGFDISKVTEGFFSSKEREAKATIEKSIEADANKINKTAEEVEQETVELQEKIDSAVEDEITKIYEKLPTERKKRADKAIAALENFQKKIRSKTYDATIGIPVAIIDGGISVVKRAIKAGVAIADAIEIGINHIRKKYGKDWAKEDEFRNDMVNGFKDQDIQKEASGTPNQIVKQALIEKGFGREITVTVNKKDADGKKILEDGKPVKEKQLRDILDWKKLAGEEGSIQRMKENVTDVLENQGYLPQEIAGIQKSLEDQYNDLRAGVIEKSINELNRRNKKHITPEQKSAAKKLAELYNYGLFEKNPVEYDVLLAKAIGIDRLSPARFAAAHELGKALEIMYSTKFNGKKLVDIELRAALQAVEEKMRILLHDEAQQHGSTSLRLADMARTFMDANQRMLLNSIKQAVENPLSGHEQVIISNFDGLLNPKVGATKEMLQQRRKVAVAVYKDMVLAGGTGFGDVGTTFVSRGNLDAYINKMSNSKLFHAIASTAIGKTTLDAADSFFKAKLTEQKFAHHLIKILTQERLVDGQIVPAMAKRDAINYVSEKLTGQSFEAAQKTAKEIIDKVNKDQPKKILSDTQAFIDRLANDIVKAALVNGNIITSQQVTAAYNSAYKAAGRSMGHEANNPLSDSVLRASANIEGRINNAIKDKEYKKAALLTVQSIFFRNIMNPFVGGGTNWIVLKFEKNGLGLLSGLYNGGRSKPDLTTEAGLKNLEKAMYEETRDRDAFMRGAIGGATSLLLSLLWFGVTDDDEYRKWRNRNQWAKKYLDLFTPEAVLAAMEAKNKDLEYYLKTVLNKNESFDKVPKAIKAVTKFASGKPKQGKEAFGLTGEVFGGSFGIPIPWRLVRDGQNIWLGASGEKPYKINSVKPKTFWEGALKAGLVDYIKNNPANKK